MSLNQIDLINRLYDSRDAARADKRKHDEAEAERQAKRGRR